jgi:Ca-activated chloride channel family protein
MSALFAVSAFAEPPRDEVASANALLRRGHPGDALEAYRNLQIDDPESSLLYYNIGCAQLESAGDANADDPAAAAETLTEARASFDKAAMAEDPAVRRDARFNRVNVDSQLAKRLSESGDYEAATKAFEEAIYGYEDFLEQYPDHEGAQQNLDHMRYLLKKMLQNPPPEQEQQNQQQNEREEGEGDNQNQQQQDQQSEEGEQQEGDQQRDQSEQQSSDESDQSKAGENDEQEDQPGQDESEETGDQSSDQDTAGSEGDDQQAPGDEASGANEPGDEQSVDLPNKETIEAILDALKERDKQEQHNMRRVPQDPRRTGQWW